MFDAPAIIERVRFRPGWVLGELVVIILGVLIALGADRWNQDRVDQIAEREYLEALAADLQTDTASQSREIVRAREREEGARHIRRVVLQGEPITDPEAFVMEVVSTGTYGEPVQARETFDDLTETGRRR